MVLRWLIKIIYHTINEISGTIDLCGALWRKFKEAVETILELLYWEIKVDTVTVPKQFWKYYREVFNYEYKIYCLIYIIFIIIYLYLCYKKKKKKWLYRTHLAFFLSWMICIMAWFWYYMMKPKICLKHPEIFIYIWTIIITYIYYRIYIVN